jgi:hypothetical protein
VEVRIGVQNVARELTFESEESTEAVTAAVEAALSSGSLLRLTDDRGRLYLVPTASIGYVHLGDSEKGRVGFGAR